MKSLAWLKKAVALSGLFLISGLFSTSVFAANFRSFFTIAKHDMSLGFLETIFGQVGGLFGANPPALLNAMFREFNTAILILAFFVVLYIVIISIINTAHQGEFLGKKLDSMWVPMRVLVGILVVIPLPCGYSTIQVIMMWVVIQGVGAADSLWSSVGTYLSKSNNEMVSQAISRGTYTSGSIRRSYDILTSLTAMHREFKIQHPLSKVGDDNLVPEKRSSFRAGPTNPKWYIGYVFKSGKAIDGAVYWEDPSSINEAPQQIAYAYALDKGMNNMVMTLNEIAKDIVYENFGDGSPSGKVDMPNPLATTLGYLQTQILAAEQKDSKKSGKKNAYWEQATSTGWITAGMYYYDMAGQNNSNANKRLKLLENVNVFTPSKPEMHKITKQDNKYLQDIYWDSMGSGTLTPYMDAARVNGGHGGWFAAVGQLAVRDVISPVVKAVLVMTTAKGDPLILLQMFGNFLLTAIISVWEILMVFLLAFGAIIAAISFWQPAIAAVYHVAVLFFLPVFMLLSVLFGAAVFMAFYVPMIPYIIFTFAAIGWMIAVFETMLAAPMVAIGIADPHAQHEVLGRAEPALQMLANVFLRPSLMIFGLIGGMILAKMAVSLVMQTFFFVTFRILFVSLWHSIVQVLIADGIIVTPAILLTAAIPGIGIPIAMGAIIGPVMIIGFVVTLCMFVLINIAIINRCFSLIHLIPDRVLSWLGWQAQFGQYSQAPEQEIKQGFKSASGTMGKFGQQGLEGTKRMADSMVGHAAQRGRQGNDWNHTKNLKYLSGCKTGKSGDKVS
jgi:conjugal transfer/type IV secretion protein DotA/TraY